MLRKLDITVSYFYYATQVSPVRRYFFKEEETAMIVVMKPGVTKESRDQLIHWLKNLGLDIHISEGA